MTASGREADPRPPRTHTDDGVALVAVLLLAAAATAVISIVLPVVQAETGVVAASVERERVRYAAQGALAVALDSLRVEPSWSAVLAGGRQASWGRSTTSLLTPDRRSVTLMMEQQGLQARTGARAFRGADTSWWVLWGAAPFDSLLARPAGPAGPAIAVFVADDGADADGVPAIDSNGVIVVEVVAFGNRRSRAAVLATVRRTAPAPERLEVLSAGEGY